jgi:hypothetical protein
LGPFCKAAERERRGGRGKKSRAARGGRGIVQEGRGIVQEGKVGAKKILFFRVFFSILGKIFPLWESLPFPKIARSFFSPFLTFFNFFASFLFYFSLFPPFLSFFLIFPPFSLEAATGPRAPSPTRAPVRLSS